jgi:uncharacterized protein (UPF0332 family)
MYTSGTPLEFDWSHYLVLAKKLLDEADSFPNKEAAQRAAISRAYYAAFKKAEEFLLKRNEISAVVNRPEKDEDSERISSHWRVIRAVFYSRNQHRKKIGERLVQLRFDRQSADYHAQFRGDLLLAANNTIEDAQYVINALKVAV